MSTKEPSDESLRIEYSEVNKNMRFYGDMRFKQLTILGVFSSASLALIAQYPRMVTLFSFFNLFISTVLFIMEIRSSRYWSTYYDRGRKIEQILHLSQFAEIKDLAKTRFIRSTNAVRTLYVMVLLLWVYLLMFHPSFLPLTE